MNGCVDNDRSQLFIERMENGGGHSFMDLLSFPAMFVGAELAALPAELLMPEIIFRNAEPANSAQKSGDGGFPASTGAAQEDDVIHRKAA